MATPGRRIERILSQDEMLAPRDTRQQTEAPVLSSTYQKTLDVTGNDLNAIASMVIGQSSFRVVPSHYVLNGPKDQIPFFKKLYELQQNSSVDLPAKEYASRLSALALVPDLGVIPSQAKLEFTKPNARYWNTEYGPHGWHRYVGRFPPQLVRALLNHFKAGYHSTICDPFAGSGTTLVESRLVGARSIGIEVCPLSALLCRAKGQFPDNALVVGNLLREFQEFYRTRWAEFVGSESVSNLSHDSILARPGNQVPRFSNIEKWLTPEALLGTSIAVEFALTKEGLERDLVSMAISARMRSIGNVDVDVVRAEYRKTPRTGVDVLRVVGQHLFSVESDIRSTLETHRSTIAPPSSVVVREGSMLEVDIGAGSIDHIITSPPYGVESISYLRTYLLSYRTMARILGRDPYEFDSRIVGNEYLSGDDMPHVGSRAFSASPRCKAFFQESGSRPSEEKLVSRRRMMIHFFDQLDEVGARFHEWLKVGGRLAFVIGNKRIGSRIIPSHEIIEEIFSSHGLRLDGLIQHKLKCNNSTSQVPWQERIIDVEHVMLFTNS